jgi:heat shock protein HslJ
MALVATAAQAQGGTRNPGADRLAVPATFSGTLPCASCPGIRVTLTLLEDGTYRRRVVYLEAEDGEDRELLDVGQWRLARSGRLVLTGAGDQGGEYELVSADELRLRSNKGLPLESDLPYELRRSPELERLESDTGAVGVASRCFGNEPSWSVDFATAGEARLAVLGERPVVYRGSEMRDEPRRERVWRGAPVRGRGDLVAFLADTACSDGMSDTSHPVTARVSLPDGRFLAGCCRVPTRPGAEGSARSTLEGVTWRLVSLTGLDPAALAAAPRPLTVLFESGRVAGFAGCNQFGGSYAIEGDRMSLGALVATKMACAEAAMSLETAFHEAFTGVLRVTRDGDRLTFAAASEASPATLVFEAEPAPSLEGATWEATGYNDGREAVVSPVQETKPRLVGRPGGGRGWDPPASVPAV